VAAFLAAWAGAWAVTLIPGDTLRPAAAPGIARRAALYAL